jgi:hypothetical protein
MQYIKQELTEFTSTNLTDSYPDWVDTTTYIVEPDNALTSASIARYGSYYYRSVTSANLNFNPSVYENIKWVKHSVSNKYAMLDMSSNSKSIVVGGDLTVTFIQNQSSVLGIGNYEADYITIDILAPDGTTILWTYETPSNINANVYDYYDYIYEPYNLDQDFTTKVNLPIQGRYVRLTFHKLLLTNRSACGYLIVGNPVGMGMSLMQPKFGYNSLTTKDISSFGNLDINKSFVQDIVDFETVIASTYLPRMRRELKKIYDEIVLFIIDERDVSEYENLMTLGVIQDASVVLENNVESVISFSVIEAL